MTKKKKKVNIGDIFTRLEVIAKGTKVGKYNTWLCMCICGKEHTVATRNLNSGDVKSCGCLKGESHGDTRTHKLYEVWNNMKARCYYSKNPYYYRYGGRGISVCQEWRKSYITFKAWCLGNGWKKDLQIDRIEEDGNYCPSNCQFLSGTSNTKKMLRDSYEKSIGFYSPAARAACKDSAISTQGKPVILVELISEVELTFPSITQASQYIADEFNVPMENARTGIRKILKPDTNNKTLYRKYTVKYTVKGEDRNE